MNTSNSALDFNPTQLRIVSNKENSSSSMISSPLGISKIHLSTISEITSTSSIKPRIGGIGKAPGSKQGGRFKPYPRIPSVQRAKAKANKPVLGKDVLEMIEERSKERMRNERREGERIKLPLRLPMPRFPEVEIDQNEFPDLQGVPVEYIRDTLNPLLRRFLACSHIYRPVPHLTPFPRPIKTTVDGKTSTRFTAPELAVAPAPVYQTDPTLDRFMETLGCKPDVVLAIHKRDDNGDYESPKIVVASKLVLASRCSHWSELTSWESTTPVPYLHYTGSPLNSALSNYISPHSSHTDTESIPQTIRQRSVSLPPTPPPSNPDNTAETEHTLILPVIPIFLPDPNTFSLIFDHLHRPTISLLPSLLDLSAEDCKSREGIMKQLRELSLEDLYSKLSKIHRVWKNLCVLGIGQKETWLQMGHAWGCVLGCMVGKGWKNEEMEMDE
ncbi:hypothetical protein M231_04265 [Tremella mesenterica]|uniref:Uncharacterized protein n=1 Tax=Tremella mesenterica TaxID=5217 RepID=A0A4Q1BL43_TREME|nr:hypothetical protein M231_04265 [Tremella mesenterica]